MLFFKRYSTSILVVCTANICRSPMAEGMLRTAITDRGLHKKILVDSAGTHAYQSGRAPDPRAVRICEQEGISIRRVRARQIRQKDFERFDYILAMDARNYDWLAQACPETFQHKIFLIGSWVDGADGLEIIDPYYGSRKGFSQVFTMLQKAIDGFLVKKLEDMIERT